MKMNIELSEDDIKQAVREYLQKRKFKATKCIHLHPYIADSRDPRETSGCTASTEVETEDPK